MSNTLDIFIRRLENQGITAGHKETFVQMVSYAFQGSTLDAEIAEWKGDKTLTLMLYRGDKMYNMLQIEITEDDLPLVAEVLRKILA
jgi:hypothetical protein